MDSCIIDNIPRYSKVIGKTDREIVLLKSLPCAYGKCAFCDYILDNEVDRNDVIEKNRIILSHVTGEFGCLETIDSASFFDLPDETILDIKNIVEEKKIKKLFLESHYIYKNKIQKLRDFFGIEIVVKIGIESFDEKFRNDFLKKGIFFKSVEELKKNFDSPCLMVGIKGQTKEMIETDIKILEENFNYGTINVYCNNSTPIKRDDELVKWFMENYSYLKEDKRFDFLYENTDFGVGN